MIPQSNTKYTLLERILDNFSSNAIAKYRCSDHSGCLCMSVDIYRDLPMNFLLTKLSHHLLGVVSSSWYTRASNRTASSCRTCDMYCLSCSASCRSLGGSYI